jgi:hypothetical protein
VDDEFSASPWAIAACFDLAAAQFHQRFDQAQSDAQPAWRRAGGPWVLREQIEDPGQHLRRNTCARVTDAKFDCVV